MQKTPLFSVIIPTYHRDDQLAQCLDCLAPTVQTLPAEHYEVIVSDDGSTTTSQALIAERYPWVRWVAGPGRGPAANRNNGAAHAYGEWLVFTDDDCLPDAQWLAAYGEAIAPDIQVYEGKTTCAVGLRSPFEHAPINLTGGCLWSCNLMIKTVLFRKIKGFDETFPYPHMEDIDLRERLNFLEIKTKFIPSAVVDHPPRKLPWGNQLGASQESVLFYWSKHKKTSWAGVDLLNIIVRTRLRTILSFPISLNSVKAILSMITEIIYVVIKLGAWKRKYSL
ncbi:MAG TPA: glycosyltransferase family A protein [Cyanophyceae cyanobacterium]